jgi:C_GCAxxG_C_C family probable redox protein
LTPLNARQDKLIHSIGQRARNAFMTRQLWCAEAVFVVLNQALRGGLRPEAAQQLVSGFGEGMGGGCICGALSGGTLALGLFNGSSIPGLRDNKPVMASSRQLHDRFKTRFGFTCCRKLTRKVRKGSRDHYTLCAEHTGAAAEMAAEIILHQKPKLMLEADWSYLSRRETLLSGRLKGLATLCKLDGSRFRNSVFAEPPNPFINK